MTNCCSENPGNQNNSLLSIAQTAGLAALFKLLGNQTRLRMLHALTCCNEMCVTELAARLGMKTQAISNQLQRLVDRGIVVSRRQGNNIFYKIVDPCVVALLDRGVCLMQDAHKTGLEASGSIEDTEALHTIVDLT